MLLSAREGVEKSSSEERQRPPSTSDRARPSARPFEPFCARWGARPLYACHLRPVNGYAHWLHRAGRTGPELGRFIEAWPRLLEHVRSAILTLAGGCK